MDRRLFTYLRLLTILSSLTGQSLICPGGHWQCDDGRCIPAEQKCDGQGACLDGSDEMNCGGPTDCPAGQFACVDSTGCVDASARCDGRVQCPTGSDEENCPAVKGCLDSDWTCRNHICIPKELHCNGENDCLDNSDEEACGRCAEGGIRCPGGTCWSSEQKCDGQVHCSDGSDEPITCGRVCSVNNGGCSHMCSDKPWGALCSCRVGYKLSPNGAVCEDVDECAASFPPCVHHCMNTVGSYSCHCRDGFQLQGSSMCLVSDHSTWLLTFQTNALGLLNVKSSQFTVIQPSVFNPVALAFDINRGWFYWADRDGIIYKIDKQQSWTPYTGEPGIQSLACDWLNGNLFWTNQMTGSIYMLAVDGKSYTTVLSRNIKPSELVLVPVESLMFWINVGPGDRVTLDRSWMDGSARSSLSVITAQSAHSLTSDITSRRLYWISDFKGAIETIKLDGTGRFSITGLFNHGPALGLAVFGSAFYWVDDKGLWQVLQNRLSQKSFISKAPLPLLEVYHELQQPKAPSGCMKSPCQFCQLTKANLAGFICACPNSKVLLLDGKCEFPRFLYNTVSNINLLEFRGKDLRETQLFKTSEGIGSFDVDWYRDLLYWTNRTGSIQRTNFPQVKIDVIPTPLPACYLTIDQRSGILYYMSCDQHGIGSEDNSFSRWLYHSTNRIQNLQLDWLRGVLFWQEEGRLFRMSTSAGKAEELLQMTGTLSGHVAYDLRANSLLWNTKQTGLITMSLVQDRNHQAGRRWNISGSVIAAFEPFLLSVAENTMTLWDRRNGTNVGDVTVRDHVFNGIPVLWSIRTGPPDCKKPSLLCQHSSICVSTLHLCDGEADCPEGDDEEHCGARCSEKDFQCKDQRSCISRTLVCDGEPHCRDGSDEVDCPKHNVKRANAMKCRFGSVTCKDGSRCILNNHVCDGEQDCEDGSDEQECDVPQDSLNVPKLGISSSKGEPNTIALAATPPTCISPRVLCPSTPHQCISPRQICDGWNDCPDGFDENLCIKACPLKTDFLCRDRRSCASEGKVCDGRSDCHDGSDEVDCPSAAPQDPQKNIMGCRLGSRLCGDGTECVLNSHVCDGERDCRDGSDEEGCESAPMSEDSQQPNPSSPPGQPLTHPPTKPPCTSPSFQCPGSSLCLKPTQLCDGKKDCPDGSDEKCVQTCPYTTDFLCRDRRSCVSGSKVCDGRSDCHDGSDEVDCPSAAPQASKKNIVRCRLGSRLCGDGTECVLNNHVCDGERDCRDGSDEEGCERAGTVEDNQQSDDMHRSVKPFTHPPTKPPCTSLSFQCPDSSLCLKPTQLCDGKKDCPDGSDEKCVQTCPYTTDFLCRDRRSCASDGKVCDGRSDCHDGSDEVDCPSAAPQDPQKNIVRCRLGSRLCGDGTECVLNSHVCDGERDCRDGSDEEGCESAPTSEESQQSSGPPSKPVTHPPTKPPCTSTSFQCPGSSLCLKPTQLCDGKKDCPDGSDEKCVQTCPYTTDFLCRDRRSCVSDGKVCDGRSDCHDGSDEVDCPSAAPQDSQKNIVRCRLGSRLCGDGTECVLTGHICDGEVDCRDGSDEEGCETVDPRLIKPSHLNDSPTPIEHLTHPPTKPPCTSPSFQCPDSSLCLKPTQLCDGKKDCPDGSDEKCVQTCRYTTDFLCSDRRSCLSKHKVCDGRSDCHDGSDEVDCPSAAPQASKNIVRCRLGSRLCGDGTECVLNSHVCDGERDCRDGSDEEGCESASTSEDSQQPNPSSPPGQPLTHPPTKPPCTSPSFQCPGSSLCLKPTQLCDGKKDCPDGSDEKCVQTCRYTTDFLCRYRRSCVSGIKVCDGRSDCHDGSDEVDCPSAAPQDPQKNKVRCRLGSRLCGDRTECVLNNHVCDGERDCRDGSDEEGCEVTAATQVPPSASCKSPSVQCPGSSVCLKPTQLCDGKRDCPDGSDESCEKKCADKTDFLCKDNQNCISRSLVCDGSLHCQDGSDELSCSSSSSSASRPSDLKCRVGSKPCANGKECVLYSHICDGELDCMDGSDEKGCPTTCKLGEFQCSHGKMCIPEAQVCDGRPQCRDLSDEGNCRTATKSCEHRCLDGKRCIPKKFLCDGEKDCLDGTDEMGCAAIPSKTEVTPASVCPTPSVHCPGSKVCLSPKQFCDGRRDCPDGFDEKTCVFKCKNPDEFLCSDHRRCITKKEVCDGHAQCLDNSDENQCSEQPASSSIVPDAKPERLKCRRGFKPCKDGLKCVMYSHVCDGEKDCRDGSDEEGCASKCRKGEFQCTHGKKCISQEQVCNGQFDCQDRSDEMNCSSLMEGCHHRCDNRTRCVPETFLCDGEKDCADGSDEAKCGLVSCPTDQYRCASGQCVSEALRCDGYADCSDRSDEADCPRPPHCPLELRCPHTHECLQKEWLCDGDEDCRDGSDEKNCIIPPAKCRLYQWQCGDSSQCIPLFWRCDGKRDCYNGMDEDKCKQRKCPSHLYRCGSGECVETSLVCNGYTNCIDGTDEGAGCTKNCLSPKAPQCDHQCVNTPHGPKCFCTAGFRLQSNGFTCVDIDECDASPHSVCKHLCLNSHGSYTCHCHPGFYLEPDNKSCKTKDEPLLLASVQSELLQLGVHSGTLQRLYSVSQPVFYLDYDWAQHRIYWLSPKYQSVRWVEMKNPNAKGTLIKGVKSDYLAVDWVGKNLYWVDGLVGQILAVKLSDATLKSQDYTVVLGEDLEQPSSLVLLPHKGLMLWSEIGSRPQIELSGMDGSKRKVLVNHDLSWPVSLAYDLLDNRVYWADVKLHCIGSASLEGDQIKILQLVEMPNPFSVAVFNDRVFWSDTKRRTIRTADKNTGKDQKVLLKRPGQPFGLKLMHSISQPAISSPCEHLRCSHLCLLAPIESSQSAAKGPTAVCRCPKALLLSSDKRTCSLPVDSSFLLLLSRQTIYQIFLRALRRDGVSLKKMPSSRALGLPRTNEAIGLDVSMHDHSLYVTYSGQKSVDVLRLSSSTSRQAPTLAGQMLQLKDDFVTALAVDWVTANLYWSGNSRPDILVTSRYHDRNTSLLQGSGTLKGITSIALHPPSGQLCYTAIFGVRGESKAEVDCVWMDGRNKAVLWRKSSVPTSLVFTNNGTIIYWADAGEGLINSIGMDGTGHKQFKAGPGVLVSFTRTSNIILWVTLSKDVSKVWFSDGLQPKQLWFETKTRVAEIRAYNNDSQSGNNSCSKNNGQCDHLCLPHPGGHTCRCGWGFYSLNVTSCTPLPACPAGQRSCLTSRKCISSSKFCDGRMDCTDQSDELDCIFSASAPSGPKGSNGLPPKTFPSNAVENPGLSDKTNVCDLQHCNGHGQCIPEGKVTRCQCRHGYKGEFCQEAVSNRSHGPLIFGIFFLVAAVITAVFIFSKRRAWAGLRRRAADKENLMANMGLPSESSDSEAESTADGKNLTLPLEQL